MITFQNINSEFECIEFLNSTQDEIESMSGGVETIKTAKESWEIFKHIKSFKQDAIVFCNYLNNQLELGRIAYIKGSMPQPQLPFVRY